MPRLSPYTDAQKSAILEAVKSGRKAGKKWPEILEAAKAMGFKSGLPYLMQFARAARAIRRRRSATPDKAAPEVAAAKKPGRPKGSKNAVKRSPGRPRPVTVSGNGAGLAGIEAIVERMVEERVGAAVAKAVTALEAAVGELKEL